VKINTAEMCPACKGSGKVNPTILVTDEIERDLRFIIQSGSKSKLILKTHPYVEAFLKKGFPSKQMNWYRKYFKWVRIQSQNNYQIGQYKFYNGGEDEIRLN
jgi:ribonuclease G